jgi:hypothetical protein
MLPDFPKEKDLIGKFWNEYLAHKHREYLGFFATIPSFSIHEGNRWKIERDDGSESEQEFEELSSNFMIDLSEVPELTPEKIMEKINTVAEDTAKKMSQSIFRELEEATEKVGNVVNAKGQPLSQEHFLQMLEKMEASFTPDGQWDSPAFVMHPNAWKANEEKFKEWEQDEEFKTKQDQIINKKREEWRAREALRKLVD